MDKNDAALMAAQETIIKASTGNRKPPCAVFVETELPFFPEALGKQCCVVAVKAGSPVIDERYDGVGMYKLLRGEVLVQREVMGKVVTVQHAVAGDWLIELASGRTTGTFAIVERPSVLLAVPTEPLQKVLGREPGFALACFREIEQQMARMQRRVERLKLRQASQRVIHFLLTESPDGDGDMVLPFRKRVWAAHLGITPETLSRTLADLDEAGWLETLHDQRFRLLRSN